MARLTISPSSRPIVTRQLPLVARPILTESRRYYAVAHSNKQFAEANRRKKAKKVKVELPKEYNVADLKKLEKFSLCDAMRYDPGEKEWPFAESNKRKKNHLLG